MDRTVARRLSLPHNVVARTFVTETVLLEITHGRYFRLDPPGGEMLDAVLEAGSVRGAAAALAERGAASVAGIARDVEALCVELLRLGLLEARAVSARPLGVAA